jgi:peptidoglycan/xylan/chitin deacetylase (PgdA/CDA1 family)
VRAILTYHSIDPSGSPISIDSASFQRHVEFLSSGTVRVVPLAQILEGGDEDRVAITFDDGLGNFAEEAWPRLKEHGLPATQFVVTGHVGRDNAWQGRRDGRVPHLRLLDWDALGRLAAEGLELGAHSRTHPHLNRLADGALADEIEGSAEDLFRRAGVRPQSFCYPFGSLDERAVTKVAARYLRACSTELAVLSERDSPHRLPRLDAFYFRGAGRLESLGSLAFRVRLGVLKTARGLRASLQKRGGPSRS